ncbi:hypothetical protein M9458_026916, partial [Cirrhinus mrigala]
HRKPIKRKRTGQRTRQRQRPSNDIRGSRSDQANSVSLTVRVPTQRRREQGTVPPSQRPCAE